MKPLVSIVLTTYNRSENIKSVIENTLKQTYDNIEIIVADDCSCDNTFIYVSGFDDSRIKYCKTDKNCGYRLNSVNGLKNATGDYLLFISDDDYLIDNYFIERAAKLMIDDSGVDVVFSRVKLKTKFGDIINKFPFENEYNSIDFINMLEKIRYNHEDFFCFSTFLFKKDLFLKIKPFESIFHDSVTVDLANIIKYVLNSKKIKFYESVVYEWFKADTGSFSGQGKNDIVKQVVLNLSAPIDLWYYSKDVKFDDKVCQSLENFLKKRTSYSFNAITSDYYSINNSEYFEKIYELIKDIDSKIYIYFKGWVGLELKKYLEHKKINISGFIDDYKTEDDVISFEKFINTDSCIYSTVLIASYKHRDVLKIYKKFRNYNDINLIDLLFEELL